MSSVSTDPNIKGLECKHVGYVTAKDGSPHDLLAVKEIVHYHDGRMVPRLRLIEDWKRPFWVTHPGHRNHKDKKEWEERYKLQEFSSTQITLPTSILRALGQEPGKYNSLRQICRSPYVYGADVTTPVLVKHHYMETWPEVNGANGSPSTVCNLDTETDMVRGTGEILMCSLAQGSNVHLILSQIYLQGIQNPESDIRYAFEYYLGEYRAKRNIQLTIEIVPDAASVAYQAMMKVHAWKPDIVAIWNMDFDINKMAKDLERAGHDLGDVFSDPTIPLTYRTYKYVQGQSQKVTQSGKTMPIPYFDRWHSVEAPATFQVIDAMCLYRKLRFTKGMAAGGYSLDAVLKEELGIRKLKFKEADHLTGGQWHAFMQANYRIEYAIYNCFDTISMQELDEKTGDLSKQIGLHSGHSEYNRFPSQPRRTWDDMHFECLAVDKVAATTSDTMRTEMDALTVDLKGHIVTLPSHQHFDTGMTILEELPDFAVSIWAHVADLDVEATYPTEEALFNISKETTACELVAIEGIDERTQRSIGINLTGGHVNAVEICTRVFKAPTLDTLLADYRAEMEGLENTETALEWIDDFSGDDLAEEESEEEF